MNQKFNANKCNIGIKGNQCSRNIKSGCTVLVCGELIRMCQQHYNMYHNVAEIVIPVHTFTGIKPITITNNVQEDTMNSKQDYNDQDYDAEMDINVAIAKMEGNEYTTYSTPFSGNYILEVCRHEECDQAFNEMMWEARGEICCGDTNCKHYTAVLCLHHTNKEEKVMTTTKLNKGILCGKCHEYHNTADEVAGCYGVMRHVTSTGSKWETKSFSTHAEAVAYQISMKKGYVKGNTWMCIKGS